jgi:hypothetical protein
MDYSAESRGRRVRAWHRDKLLRGREGFIHEPWRHISGLARMPADQNVGLFWNRGAPP